MISKKIFLNSIGSSNHLGASIPMTKKKSVKLGVDKYGNINLLNELAQELLSLKSNNTIGKKIYDIIPNSKLMRVIKILSYLVGQHYMKDMLMIYLI